VKKKQTKKTQVELNTLYLIHLFININIFFYVTKEVLIDLKKSCIKKLSSRRGNRDDLEADDEQSDWPSNEKTPLQQMKALQKKMDIESLDNLKLSVFPCWEKNDIESARKATYYETFLQDSNYEIMNRSESVEKGKELGEILNGALSLMSSTTKDIYHSKIKSMVIFYYLLFIFWQRLKRSSFKGIERW